MKDRFVWYSTAVLSGGFLSVYQESQEARIWILAFLLLLLLRYFLWKPKDFAGRWFRPDIFVLIIGLLAGSIYGMVSERFLAVPLKVEDIKLSGILTDWIKTEDGAEGQFKPVKIYDYKGVKDINSDASASDGDILLEELIGKKYSLKVYSQESKGESMLAAEWQQVSPGDTIMFHASLQHPAAPGTDGGFDYPLYNAVRGLSGTIIAKADTVILEKGKPSLAWRCRDYVHGVLYKYWPQETAVMEGILFGDSSQIPNEVIENYKTTGVLHVFAASGANVAFVIALIWGIFYYLPLSLRTLICAVSIVFYAILCGCNPPILRAVLMGIAVLGGIIGKGKVSSLRWLIFAAVILFFYNPLYLKDIGFQLSFAASWGIIVLTPRLENSPIALKIPLPLRKAGSAAVAAQIATLPFLIQCFHRISLVGFVTNIFILFILGAVLQFGLIGIIMLIYEPLARIFFQVAVWFLRVTNSVLDLLAGFPLADFWVLNPGISFFVLWYVLLGIWLIGWKRIRFILLVQLRKSGLRTSKPDTLLNSVRLILKTKKRLKYTVLLSCSAALIILLTLPLNQEELHIHFLDVGQGDCILVETSQEKLLIDTGPRTEDFDSGERIVLPYLLQKGIGDLDALFMTHEDNDHIGGANYLLHNIPTRLLGIPDSGERLQQEEWRTGIPSEYLYTSDKLFKLKAGDKLCFGSGLEAEVLAPVSVIEGTGSDANNNSLVLRLNYLSKTILLTGDMEIEEMKEIADRGRGWNADFIKLPHHGGKSSFAEDWFAQTTPQCVFISVGKNRFGHPSQPVLEYWKERGIPVYRTDIQGTIELIIDKSGFTVKVGRE